MISRRLFLTASLALGLSGCGFRLRGTGPVVGELPPRIRLQIADPFSPLAREISRQLTDQGVELTDSSTDAVTLSLTLPEQTERVLGPLPNDREQVELALAVTYRLVGPDLRELVPSTEVKATLVYVDSGADTSAEASRVAQLARGLEADLFAQVVPSIRVRYAQALKAIETGTP